MYRSRERESKKLFVSSSVHVAAHVLLSIEDNYCRLVVRLITDPLQVL